MSEVAKMYENAHIEKVINHECTYDYGITCPNDNDTCENCGYYKEKEPDYPPFTAKKQLELIKWLLDNKNIGFLKFEVINGKYEVYDTYYECDKYRESLDEALADYICCLWQDLTEQERTEIAEILRR